MHPDFHILDPLHSSTSLILLITIETTLVVALAAIVAIAGKKASAASRAIVWIGAIAATIAIPIVALVSPGFGIPLLDNRDEANRSSLVTRSTSAEMPSSPSNHDRVQFHLSYEESKGPRLSESNTASPTRFVDPLRTRTMHSNPTPQKASVLASIVFMIWPIGFMISILSNIIAFIRLRSIEIRSERIESGSIRDLMDEILTRLKIQKRVPLIKGCADVMPMTWGTIRPIVLLPSGVEAWSDDRSRVVLTHEAAHIRRLDHFTQAIARCAVAIHWFNPFVRVAAKALRIESERACDDLTLELGETPSIYAAVLLETARSYRDSRFPLGTAGIAVARKSRLEARVSAILDPLRNRQEISRRSLIAIVSTFLLMSIILGSIRPTMRTASAAPPKTEARSKVTDLVKRPSGPMSFGGRVIDLETKKPIEGAKIVVNRFIPGIDRKDAPAWVGDETLRSDADGRFTLAFTAEQIAETGVGFIIYFDHPDYIKRRSRRSSLIEFIRSIEAGEKPFFETIFLEHGLEYSGEFVDPEGRAVPNVHLHFDTYGMSDYHYKDYPVNDTTSDLQGRFRVRLSKTRLLRMYATPSEHATYYAFYGTHDFDHPKDVWAQTDLGRITLERGVRVSGKLIGLDGKPLAGESVEIVGRLNARAGRTATTALDGSFSFAPLTSSSYIIESRGRGEEAGEDLIEENSHRSERIIKPVTIDLKNTDVFKSVELHESPSIRFAARFVDSKGRSTRGYRVHIRGNFPGEPDLENPRFEQLDGPVDFLPTVDGKPLLKGPVKTPRKIIWNVYANPDHEGKVRLRLPKGIYNFKAETFPEDSEIGLRTRIDSKSPPIFWGRINSGFVDSDLTDVQFICYHSPQILLHIKTDGGEHLPEPIFRFCSFVDNGGGYGERFEEIKPGEYRTVSILPDLEYEISAYAPGYFASKIPHVNLPEGASAEYTIRLKKKPEPAKIGDAAPPFTAKTLDGRTINLIDFKGKYVLLDFFTVMNRSVLSEALILKDISKKFGDDPRFAMIGFSIDRDFDSARKIASDNKLDWPRTVLIEGTNDPIAAAYGANDYPSIYLVDPQGKLIAKDLRGNAIEAAVSRALGEVKK